MTDKHCTTETRNRRVQANQQPQRQHITDVSHVRSTKCQGCGMWLPFTIRQGERNICPVCFDDEVRRGREAVNGTS